MRRQHGLDENEIIVFFNPRCTVDQSILDFYRRLTDKSIRVVMPSAFAPRHPSVISLPTDETESQNGIAMCDCVVTRCGYSTVSEAVQGSVPLIVWERPGFIEDQTIVSEIERLGVGRSYEYEKICSLDWISDLSILPRYKQHYEEIDPNYNNSGSQDILSCLQEFIA